MSLIFPDGSRTQTLPPPGSGKPKTSPFGPPQPAGNSQYPGSTPQRTNAGQAQSTPAPSQGTKYGAYSPRPPSSQTTGDPRGAYAAFAPSQRPPPIQMGVAQTPWGQSMDPFAERDAFVNQIGQQRINNQIAFNTSGPQAPQGSPFINYDMARQNAGLAGGAPSMNANPADTFIGRFNNQYGAPVNPGFGGGQPPQFSSIYAPGTDISKLPFTDDMQPNPSYRPQVNPPQSPGRAQPIAPQQPPAGYNPGVEPRLTVIRPAAPAPTSSPAVPPAPAPGSQPRRGRSADIRSPDEIEAEARTKASLGSPGSAQPIGQSSQGTPYSPAGGSRPSPGNGGVYEQNGNTYFPATGSPPPPPPGFEWVKSARNQQSPLVLKRIDPATQPAKRRHADELPPVRMPYAGGMDYEQGPPVQRPGLYLQPPPMRPGGGYQPTRRR